MKQQYQIEMELTKRNIFIVFILFLSLNVFSQEDNAFNDVNPTVVERWQEGYIVTNAGDTINGMVKKRPQAYLLKIDFKSALDGKKKPYTTDDLKAYKWSDEIFERIFIPNDPTQVTTFKTKLGHYFFAKLIISGYLSLYTTKSQGFHGSLGVDQYALVKKGKEAVIILKGIFNDKIANAEALTFYLADNLNLSKKIMNDEFKYNDMEQIVKTYNSWKQSQ